MVYNTLLFCSIVRSPMPSGLLYVPCICVQELPYDCVLLCNSSQAHVQWHLVGSLKSARVRVFRPQKWAKATNRGFFLQVPLVEHVPAHHDLWAGGGGAVPIPTLCPSSH